jgi:hypothetical protein
VYVTLDPEDLLAISAVVRLVISGELSSARLSNGQQTLTLRLDEDSLRMGVSGADMRSKRALRLLGFGAGASSEDRCFVAPRPFPASRMLQQVLMTALDVQDAEVDAVLTSPEWPVSADTLRPCGNVSSRRSPD